MEKSRRSLSRSPERRPITSQGDGRSAASSQPMDQAPHPQAVQPLSPTGGVAPSDTAGLAPARLLRGTLNDGAWRDLCDRVRAFSCESDVRVLDDRLELRCPMALDEDGVRRLPWLINELIANGLCAQACDVLLMCAPSARGQVFLAIEAKNLHTLKDHGDAQVRKRFQGALMGAAEHANAQMQKRVKWELQEIVLEHLGYFCSDDSRARMALMLDDVAGFWHACAHCNDGEWADLAPLVPVWFAGTGDASDLVSNPRLFCWVCESIQAGFTAGFSQGLTACAQWLDLAEGWVDADLRRALVRGAVAHALSANHPMENEPSAQLHGVAGLRNRAWAEELTLRWFREVPAPYRERLLSAAVEWAANAPTTQALDGLVGCCMAMCDEPDLPVDDRRGLYAFLMSAFGSLLAPDSGRNETERAAIRALQIRLDRGLPDQLADHLLNKRYAAAADCIGEMCWLGGPGFALQYFQPLADALRERLKSVGLSYGLTGGGLQIGVLSEDDEDLQAMVRQVKALSDQIDVVKGQGDEQQKGKLARKLAQAQEQLATARRKRPMQQVLELAELLSLLVRCGLGDHHPLEARVRQYLDSDAMRQFNSEVNVSRRVRLHLRRAQWMERVCKDWRISMGPRWKTCAWLDQLFDLGAYGRTVLGEGEPLRTPEFDYWLEAMRQGGKVSQALLANAVAMAMDGEACDTRSMVWLFERFADGVHLELVLRVPPPPVQAGEAPLTGFDRLVRIASRLVTQTNWLACMEGEVGWRPGWTMALDFCRYVAAQAQPEAKSMAVWLRLFVLDYEHADHRRRKEFVQAVWVKALVNGLACDAPIHGYLMRDYQHKDQMKVHLWDFDNLELFLLLLEPQLLARKLDPSQQLALLRHNLAKGLLRSQQALQASRNDACARIEGYGPAFAWEVHWASALVSAARELLSQPEGASLLDNVAEDATALWAGAAKQYPQWLDTDIDPADAIWVSGLITIFRSEDIPRTEKPQHLQARVVAWRASLLPPETL